MNFFGEMNFLEEILEETVKAGGSWAVSQLQRFRGAEEELRKLNDTAGRIQARLDGAEECRIIEDESVLKWLRELKAVALDAEDLDDQFRTFKSLAKKDVAGGSGSRKRKLFQLDSSWLKSWFNSWLDGADLATKVEEIRKRYEEISLDRRNLLLRDGESRLRVPTTTGRMLSQHSRSSLHNPIVGRLDEAEEIIGILTGSGGGSIARVISIVGAGGLGKTALAKKIYGDERVVEHFSKTAWVSLSQESKQDQITKEIIESLTVKDCRLSSLDAMQSRLRQLVAGKKILLVLDNVWIESPLDLDMLPLLLEDTGDGSKILMTTRNASVSKMIGAYCHNLRGLQDEDCRLLFQNQVFAPGEAERRALTPSLERICEGIVQKCRSSPLAVTMIGSLLCSIDEEEWQTVLDYMPEAGDIAKTILPTLKVSYDCLSPVLRRCFEFCSIFPNNYKFDKDELVKLWMAVGFVEPSKRRMPEFTCGRYFKELVGRSFFQPCGGNPRQKQQYEMPGMIHELAQYVAKYECWRSENDVVEDKELKWARYALCVKPITFEKIGDSKRLRTLVLQHPKSIGEPKVLLGQLETLRFLRALDLSNCQLEVWPNSINGLILLRYLSLSSNKIKEVPESVGYLRNLQSLELGKCNQLRKISESIGELELLRYLGLDGCNNLVALPEGITKSVKLHYLGMHLHWENWEVVNVPDAEAASQKDKSRLKFLLLRWSNGACSNTNQEEVASDPEEVIRCLRPHNNLKCLWIENYSSVNFSNWIADSAFSKLETLRLSGCQGCRVISSLDQLTRLSALVVSSCPELEELSCLPPSLIKFELRQCPKLGALPIVTSLQDLEVEGSKGTIFYSIEKLTSLSSLTVSQFSSLVHLPGNLSQSLTSLKILKVKGFQKLVSLGQKNGGLTGLTSLEHLEISSCPNFKSMPELPTELQSLTINDCQSLRERCQRGGADWDKVKHIPCKNI